MARAISSIGRNLDLLAHTPTPVWLEDWSGVAAACDRLRNDGVTDLASVLESDETLLRSLVGKIEVIDVNTKAVEFVGAERTTDLIGRIPSALLTKPALRSFASQIVTVWEGGCEVSCDVSGVDLGGEDIVCRLQWAAPIVDGAPDYSNVVIVLLDTREYVAAEIERHRLIEEVEVHQEVQRETREHVNRLESLIEMSRSLVATFDRDTVLNLAVEILERVVGGDCVAAHIVDEDSRPALFVGRRPGCDQDDEGRPVPDSALVDLSSRIVARGTAVMIETEAGGIGAVGSPILMDHGVAGTLIVLRQNGPEFSEMDLSLVRMTAAQAAVGLRNADLYAELRRSHDATQLAHAELQEAQAQLVQAQKLEAIGSLAAGIAHEINTPIQFITDNVSFVAGAVASLQKTISGLPALLERAADHDDLREEAELALARWAENDCDYLINEMPDALTETSEGAYRVAEIVRAMKDFAHPGSAEKVPVDVNRVIRTTAAVSRNEWKYVAEMELDLAEDLPQIPALGGPLGQCLLILIVNSAQALAEQSSRERGRIRISSRLTDHAVEVRVADSGPGVPNEILHRVFDPFFTTKDVGGGSGQGLSIARSIVVDRHDGDIWVEQGDPGAVFVIRLPLGD